MLGESQNLSGIFNFKHASLNFLSKIFNILMEKAEYEQIKDSIPGEGLFYTDKSPVDNDVYVG